MACSGSRLVLVITPAVPVSALKSLLQKRSVIITLSCSSCTACGATTRRYAGANRRADQLNPDCGDNHAIRLLPARQVSIVPPPMGSRGILPVHADVLDEAAGERVHRHLGEKAGLTCRPSLQVCTDVAFTLSPPSTPET